MKEDDCPLCRGAAIDAELGRELVWEDALWRLTTSVGPGDPTPGFSYLEPKRHIPYVTDLQGEEASSFGVVLARCSSALKSATHAEHVYVYIFGDSFPHFHVHLAPHTAGDALVEVPIRGELEEKILEGGHTAMVSKEYPAISDQRLRDVARRARAILASPAPPPGR